MIVTVATVQALQGLTTAIPAPSQSPSSHTPHEQNSPHPLQHPPKESVGLFLDEDTTGDRQYFIFYQDEGGLRATDEENKGLSTIYYLGVIDILTPYGPVKRAEHLWKTVLAGGGDRVSALCLFV